MAEALRSLIPTLGVSDIPQQAADAREVLNSVHQAEVANQSMSFSHLLETFGPAALVTLTIVGLGGAILGVGRMMGKAAKD
jgi:hypothetical protein